MKAKDFLATLGHSAKTVDEGLLIGNVVSAINDSAELSEGQRDHVASVLKNSGARLSGFKNTIEEWEMIDRFITELATYINSCR